MEQDIQKPIIFIAGIYITLDLDELRDRILRAENICVMLNYHEIETKMPKTKAKDWIQQITQYTEPKTSSQINYSINPQLAHNELQNEATHVLFLRNNEPYNIYSREEIRYASRLKKLILNESDLERIIKTYSKKHAEEIQKIKQKT